MPGIGVGVREIRVRAGGAYRVIYLASRPEGVYVLHCFQKKTQQTELRDIELARNRLKQIRE
jgi:phage-related protein